MNDDDHAKRTCEIWLPTKEKYLKPLLETHATAESVVIRHNGRSRPIVCDLIRVGDQLDELVYCTIDCAKAKAPIGVRDLNYFLQQARIIYLTLENMEIDGSEREMEELAFLLSMCKAVKLKNVRPCGATVPIHKLLCGFNGLRCVSSVELIKCSWATSHVQKLATSPRVRELRLEGINEVGLLPFLQSMKGNTTMRKLAIADISHEPNLSWVEAASMIAENERLVRFSCEFKQSDQASSLLEACETTNRTLTTLEISIPPQDEERVVTLVEKMMEKNTVIENLCLDVILPPNRASLKTEKVKMFLKLNQAKRHKLLAGLGSNDSEWMDAMICNSDDVNVVLFCLGNNPSAFIELEKDQDKSDVRCAKRQRTG